MSSWGESRFKAALAQVIQSLAESAGGFSPLARQLDAVRVAAGEEETACLTRRQLSKIADADNIPLTCDQLQVIDEFLRQQGHSLAALLSTPYLVSALSEKGRVTFIIGSQPDEGYPRIDLSRWDVRAMREILNAVNATGQTIHVNFEDVIFREGSADVFYKPPVPDNETWYRCLEDGTSSIVCLGSPKACHAAEVMLAEMFGVEPFRPWPTDRPRPFYFVWAQGDRRSESIQSAFRRSPSELQDDTTIDSEFVRELRDPESRTLGFWSDGKMYLVPRAQGESITYGVVVAQRRAGHGVWLCVCGLTGPGTFGAAQLLPTIRADLTPRSDSDQSHTAWAVVEVRVLDQKSQSFRRDQRRVISHRPIGEARYVELPSNRTSRFAPTSVPIDKK